MTVGVNTDSITKNVLLKAPRSRVWRALTNAQEFGTWFGARLTGTFAPGARIQGPITHKGYEHLTMDFTIDKVEPERLISWRWHPAAIEPGARESGRWSRSRCSRRSGASRAFRRSGIRRSGG